MKRRILTGLAVALALCALVQIIGSTRADASQRVAPKVGRYNCTRVADGPALTDLKLLSGDKYESADKAGVYAYDAGARRIEWLTGTISKQWVGFYIPKGNDNSGYDTIVIRDKKDADEGVERDLLKCTLAE
jgi:hypothetical protein